jgi:hypothetical protein
MHQSSFLAIILALGIVTSRAEAHDPPALFRVLSRDPDATILSTNRGFIVGTATSDTWSLLCSEAFGVSTGARYGAARLAGGRLVISSERGLRVSDDGGCTWRATGLGDRKTPFVLGSSTHPERLYASVYVEGEGGIRRSNDGGETFDTLLSTKDTEFVSSLLVAAGEPERLYASITDFSTATFRELVARSTDGGAHWERSEVKLDAELENDLTLLAVNPRRPDELLAKVNAKEPVDGERILWSRDGGKTFTSPITLPAVTGGSFSEDGTIAYVSSRDGLHRASGPERKFEPFGEASRISSVAERDGDLIVGGYYQGLAAGQDGVATAAPGTAPPRFERLMNFSQVRAQLSCPAPAKATADCTMLWVDWQTEFGLDAPRSDGGAAADAGIRDAGSSPPRQRDEGCTLGAPGARGGARGALLAMLALSWFARRRRTRARGRAPRTMLG